LAPTGALRGDELGGAGSYGVDRGNPDAAEEVLWEREEGLVEIERVAFASLRPKSLEGGRS